MPSIFIGDWEGNMAGFHAARANTVAMQIMIKKVAEAAGVENKIVDVHFIPGKSFVWRYLVDEPSTRHGVRVEVHWFEGRNDDQKSAIAEAIFEYCRTEGIEHGFNLKFCDYPKGSFYIEHLGKLIDL